VKEGARVALITPRYAPFVGGVERHVEKLALGLVERGVEIEVITTDPTGRLAPFEVRDGVVIRRFHTVARGTTYLLSPALGNWLARHASRFTLLHAHSYHAPLVPQASLVSRLTGVPLVVTTHFHGTSHLPLRRGLHLLYRPVARLVLRQARAIICVTQAEHELLDSRLHLGVPTFVVPSGLDLAEVRETVPHATPPKTKIVIVVARLELYKQVQRVAAALEYLPRDYRLVVVGDGPARREIYRTARDIGHLEQLLVFPELPRQELLSWYLAADAAVSLSLMEAQGLTVMEAMASGCPVVVSDIPAHREAATLVPEGRLTFVPPRAPAAEIARAISAVIEHPNGHTTDFDHARSWVTTTQGTLDCYAYALAAGR
jgi:glycosyltransferase involved in cell wall biosynthesis